MNPSDSPIAVQTPRQDWASSLQGGQQGFSMADGTC